MFLFLRLLLAHFIGDFPLQSDLIFRLKHEGLKGILPHALVILLCCATLSWPYLHLPQVWIFIVFVSVLHLFQDSLKLSYSVLKHSLWTYLLDQLFHVATISLIFFTGLKDIAAPAENNNILIALYNNDLLIIYVIALILATYNGYFLIRSFRNTFCGCAGKYSLFEKWFGMAERALIVTFFIIQGKWFILLPAVLLLRPMVFSIFGRVLSLEKSFTCLQDILLSWSVAMLTGLALFLLQAFHLIY